MFARRLPVFVRPRPPLAAAVAAGALAAGCGVGAGHGDPAAAARVQKTVQTALADLASGNGRAFCALVTPAEGRRLARQLAHRTCSGAMHAVGSGLSQRRRVALAHARVGRVTVSGRTARVAAADIATSASGFLDDGGTPTTLVRRPDGRWLISG